MLAGVLDTDRGADAGPSRGGRVLRQHQLQALHLDKTVYQELDGVAPAWTQSEVRSLLGAFLFKGDDVDKKVRVLSGGRRAACAREDAREASPLPVLGRADEHLDIASSDVLEQPYSVQRDDRADHARPAPDQIDCEQDR